MRSSISQALRPSAHPLSPMAYIDQFFEVLVNAGASDLHLGEGQPPKIRRHGEIVPIRDEALTHDEMAYMMSEICGPERWAALRRNRRSRLRLRDG